MSLDNGYVKLWRSLLTWEWHDDAPTVSVYIHLILLASINTSTWHGVEIPRGSLVSSYSKIASQTGLSFQQARTAVKHLISTGEVTMSAHPKFTVFTLNNYDKFQDLTRKSTSKPQAKQQANSNVPTSNQQQYKNINNIKKEEGRSTPPLGEISETPIFVEEEVMEI